MKGECALEQEAVVQGVRALVNKLRGTIEGSFGAVWVEGEVTGVRIPASGHCYFDLVEADAKLPAVFFRGRMHGRPAPCLADGNRIRAHGALTIYPRQGKYQILVDRVRPAGQGDLLAKLEALKRRLAAEGLFDPARKRPLPFLPRIIGVVTSSTGAAIRDICRTIGLRYPARILLAPARVQGSEAAAEIAAGIRLLDRIHGVDVIIVGRGGGSLEDLFSFNDEDVVRAVATAQTPVISGVGHEVDVVLCDHVADHRAATPTAAGECAVPSMADLLARIAEARSRLQRRSRRRIELARMRLDILGGRLRDPRLAVRLHAQRLDELSGRLDAVMGARMTERRTDCSLLSRRLQGLDPSRRLVLARARLGDLHGRLVRIARHRQSEDRLRLGHLHDSLRTLSPEAHLDRGYALVRHRGRVLRDATTLSRGEQIEVLLRKGALDARVCAVRPGPFDPKREGSA